MEDQVTNALDREWLPIRMIFLGILVGFAASVVSVVYRFMLQYSESILFGVIGFTQKSMFLMIVWLLCLCVLGFIVAKIVQWEGMCSGSGIPQVQGEIKGYFNVCWWKLLLSKMIGGALCIIGGLSLGREGPSVHLGAMAGKGLAKGLHQDMTTERYMISCGAGSGLAAAFNAPIAGVVFALEEIQKNFNPSMLVCILAGCVTSDFVSKNAFGLKPVFTFDVPDVIPLRYYGFLIVFGMVLGLGGALYNVMLLKGQDMYKKITKVPFEIRMMIPFVCAGFLAYILPDVLAGGHAMIELVYHGCPALQVMILLLVVKSLFSALSFGSSAPGGIFFPLLIAGAYFGSIYGTLVTDLFNVSDVYIASFIILGMSGFFTAIVRAPITGIILIAEMTGGFEHLLPLAVVTITAYIFAHLTGVAPIYESLLDRQIAKAGRNKELEGNHGTVVLTFIIGSQSMARDKYMKDVPWPEHSIVCAVDRQNAEIVPKGDTMLCSGDVIVVTAEREYLKMIVDAYQIISGEVDVQNV